MRICILVMKESKERNKYSLRGCKCLSSEIFKCFEDKRAYTALWDANRPSPEPGDEAGRSFFTDQFTVKAISRCCLHLATLSGHAVEPCVWVLPSCCPLCPLAALAKPVLVLSSLCPHARPPAALMARLTYPPLAPAVLWRLLFPKEFVALSGETGLALDSPLMPCPAWPRCFPVLLAMNATAVQRFEF